MKDVQALARAVHEILQSPDQGRAIGNLARDYAAVQLDVRTSVNNLIATYVRLASKHASRTG